MKTATTRRPMLLAIAAFGLVGVTACSSNPSPTRVAQDLVKTVESDPEVQACMLGVIQAYDLNQLGEDATSDNADTVAAAQVELDKYEADLIACK